MSRARLAGALTSAGLAPASIILRRDPSGQIAHGLIDVDGYVTDDDPRLANLGEVRRPVVLGAYAVPVEGEAHERAAAARRSAEDRRLRRRRIRSCPASTASSSCRPTRARSARRRARRRHIARLPPNCTATPTAARVELRRAIGARFKLDPDKIVCGTGSDELIQHLCHIYGGPGTEIIDSRTASPMYAISATYAGSRM